MHYFVTGGSRGIGRAIVIKAVEEGHDVAFTYATDRSSADNVCFRAGQINPAAHVQYYQLNVADAASVRIVVEQVLVDFETIDVVVNNAGVSRNKLAAVMTDEEWNEIIAVNLSGAFYVCRAFLPALIAQRFGRIVNISSIISQSCTAGFVNYAASKAGLNALTKVLAKEYGTRNITSNVVIVGAVETDMTRSLVSANLTTFIQQHMPRPKHQVGQPSEVADVVTFLASERASFINGAEIFVTGGLDTAL